jgi:hypothetical protein
LARLARKIPKGGEKFQLNSKFKKRFGIFLDGVKSGGKPYVI